MMTLWTQANLRHCFLSLVCGLIAVFSITALPAKSEEKVQLNLVHDFDLRDQVFRNVIKQWAYALSDISGGSIEITFSKVDGGSDTFEALESGAADLIFYKSDTSLQSGIEALANLPLNQTGKSNADVSIAIWETYKSVASDVASLYEGAIPIGFAAYHPASAFSVDGFAFEVSEPDYGSGSFAGRNYAFRNDGHSESFLITSASSAVEFVSREGARLHRVEVEIEPLGREAGVMLISSDAWQALDLTQQQLIFEQSADVLAQMTKYLDARDAETIQMLTNRWAERQPSADVISRVSEISEQRHQLVKLALQRAGIPPEPAVHNYLEAVGQ